MSEVKPAVVLIVEDEPLVRLFAEEILTKCGGYAVLVAAHADEALTLLHGRPDVRVLFTDVNMPGTMDGIQLAHVARQQWPRLAIIVTSGRGATGVLPPDASFIMKPYTPAALVELIAGILRSPAEPIIFTRLERGATKTSGAPVLPGPVNLDGLNMGNGTTSGLAQPLAGGDE